MIKLTGQFSTATVTAGSRDTDLTSIIGIGTEIVAGEMLVFQSCGHGDRHDVVISGFGSLGQVYVTFVGYGSESYLAVGRNELFRPRV